MSEHKVFVVHTATRRAELDVEVPAYTRPGPVSYALFIDTTTEALAMDHLHAIRTSVEAVGKTASGLVVLSAKLTHEMVVHIEGVTDELRKELVTGYFPGQNFPYAREALAQLTARSGYPAALMPPLLYQRKTEDDANGQAKESAEQTTAEIPEGTA